MIGLTMQKVLTEKSVTIRACKSTIIVKNVRIDTQ